MRYLIVLILFSLIINLSSCSDKSFIYYKYNGVTITRIDREVESRFYYGYYNYDKFPGSYIIFKYPHGDQLMSGYIVFNSDKSVALIPVADDYEKVGDDSLFYLKKYNDNTKANAWLDSIQNHYNNVVVISDDIKGEQENNNQNHSKVEVIYK